MKKNLKHGFMLVACIGTFLLTGCGTIDSGGGAGEIVGPSTGVPANDPGAVSAVKGELWVALNIEGPLATSDLKDRVEGTLADQGYVVREGATAGADVTVTLLSKSEQFDKLGNYYVFKGTVQTNAVASTTQVLGKQEFTEKSKRTLGPDDATMDLADKLAGKICPWLDTVCTPAKVGIAAQTLTVSVPKLRRQTAYMPEFVTTVSSIDGVRSCQVLTHDAGTRTFSVRVVYDRDTFPAGLVNKIKSISSLHLK